MQIRLRELQHFLYCPHRWGLMEIGDAWAENYYVVKANLEHERVHNPKNSYTSRGKKVLTSVCVYNDHPDYELQGVTDCIECTPDKSGVQLSDGKRYSLCIVEYKPRAPKNGAFREEDAMQLFGQKLCVDAIFGCSCAAAFYYIAEKKRVPVSFGDIFEEYDRKLKSMLQRMREYKEKGIIPTRIKGQNCSGCSFRDMCMPGGNRTPDLRSRIREMTEESES